MTLRFHERETFFAVYRDLFHKEEKEIKKDDRIEKLAFVGEYCRGGNV